MADWGKLLGDQRGREGEDDDDGNRAGVLSLVHPVMVSDAVVQCLHIIFTASPQHLHPACTSVRLGVVMSGRPAQRRT
jgi:hypothetical protein